MSVIIVHKITASLLTGRRSLLSGDPGYPGLTAVRPLWRAGWAPLIDNLALLPLHLSARIPWEFLDISADVALLVGCLPGDDLSRRR
jgi:hypothetical protein